MISGIPRYVSILPQQPPVYSHCRSSLLSLTLHDPITFRDAREDDGCTWENKTTTDPSSQHSPSRCGISISCHERKATRGSEFMWGKYESFSLSGRRQSFGARMMQGASMPRTHLFVAHSPVGKPKKKKALSSSYCMCDLPRPQHSLYGSTQILHLYVYVDIKRMTPSPPKNPRHPKCKAIFQGNWVNQQWNQDELIIPSKLFVSHI